MATRSNELESEIDALFKVPLAEFTAARNALAARLKKAGRAGDADAVKSLQKPPASAWAVNQLAWQHPKEIDALLAVGERFRAAQAAQLSGKAGDLRGLLNERRDVLAGLMKQSNAILEGAGHTASPDMGRRIATTLEALATWGRADGAPQAGRLTDDLDPPGFEALAALVPRSSGGGKGTEPPRVLPFRQEPRQKRGKAEDAEARRAKAREAVEAAEKTLREAQHDAERAEAALKTAAARAKAAEKAKAELEPRYEKAVAAAQETAKDARRIAQEAEEAAQAVSDAEQALEKAKAALAEA